MNDIFVKYYQNLLVKNSTAEIPSKVYMPYAAFETKKKMRTLQPEFRQW